MVCYFIHHVIIVLFGSITIITNGMCYIFTHGFIQIFIILSKMRRDKEIIRLVMVIGSLYYWVCQNGVKGNILNTGKSEDDNLSEEIISGEDNESKFKASDKILEENDESTDGTENLSDDADIDSDATTTLYKRVQEMPLKLGLQLLTAKYGISDSLEKARRGGAHVYEGAKEALKTVADFVGDGIGNARFLLFGSK